MEIEVINKYEEFVKLRERWNDLLGRSSHNIIFLTHEWLSAWWESQHGGDELSVILVKDGGKLIAAAPLMIKVFKIKNVIIAKKLQFIAHNASDYMDMIVAEKPRQCFEAIFGEIVRLRKKWDWGEFIFLQGNSANYLLWKERLTAPGKVIGRIDKSCVSVVLNMDKAGNSWSDYEKMLPLKRKNDLNRCRRLLSDKGELVFSSAGNYTEIKKIFAQFIAIHIRRWQNAGMVSQFEDPRKIDFYLNVAERFSRRNWIDLSSLKLNDKYIAMAFGYVYNGTYYYYTPTFEPDYGRYSPGNLLIQHLLKSFYDKGKIGTFDFLRGDEPYKQAWSGDRVELFQAKVYPLRVKSIVVYTAERFFPLIRPVLKKVSLLKWVKYALLRRMRKA